MKPALSFLFAFFLFHRAVAQMYFQGATDPSGDPTQLQSPDAQTIHHAIDVAADSLWFKIEFYERIDDVSWNVKIGIDTNGNVLDGGTWAGSNTSMHYDLLADIYSNPNFPPPFGNILDGNGAYISSNIRISFPDTNVLVAGLRLSEIMQAGVSLQYIAGTGIIAGLVNDDIPDTGFISVSGAAGIEPFSLPDGVFIYPNPTEDLLFLTLPANLSGTPFQFHLTDSQGKTVKTGTFNSVSHAIDITLFKAQEYFITISDGKFIYTQSFLKR